MRASLPSIAIVVLLSIHPSCKTVRVAQSLSHAASSPSGGLNIVGLPGGAPQSLPAQYVKSFGRWSLQPSSGSENGGQEPLDAVHLQGTGGGFSSSNTANTESSHCDEDGGFVDPTSTTDLWWPSDLASLQVRPTLDILLRGGSPAYVSAGLNVRVPPSASKDGAEWSNYGLCSQPLARQWTTFDFAMERGFRVEAFVEAKRLDGDENATAATGVEGADERTEHRSWDRLGSPDLGSLNETPGAHAVFAAERTRKALNSVGVFIASGVNEGSPLLTGFHIISLPLAADWIDLPPPSRKSQSHGEGSNTDINDEGADAMLGYRIVCVATAEPDAKELLSLDEGLVAATGSGVLEVDVSQVAPGGKSEYLPGAYRPLYK